MSLALSHTPHEAEFYLLEGAVNRLGVLRAMPHVKMVAAAHEHEAVAEVLTALKDAVAARRALFRDLDIDSIEEFRELRAAGRLPHDHSSDVFLVIDGWLDFDYEIPEFAKEVHRLANTGLNYGVHLLVSARRWSDFGKSLLGLLGTRVELALEDPSESQIDAALSARLGIGWALSRRRRFRAAVPHLEEVNSSVEARRALAETTQRMRERWLGVQPDSTPPPRTDIPFTKLLAIGDAEQFDVARTWRQRPPQERLRVPIGVDGVEPTRCARPQGGRSRRDGATRPVHRRHRLRQVGTAAHAGPRPRRHALVGDAQFRPGRLQGRCHLRRRCQTCRTSRQSSPTSPTI